jgi:hypothetical protein
LATKKRVNYRFSQSHGEHAVYINIYIYIYYGTDSRYLWRFSAGARGFLRRILAGGRRNRRIIRRRRVAYFTVRPGSSGSVGALQSGGVFVAVVVVVRKHEACSEVGGGGGDFVEADPVRIVVSGANIPAELTEDGGVVVSIVAGEEVNVVRVRSEWPARVAGELISWIGFVTVVHEFQ